MHWCLTAERMDAATVERTIHAFATGRASADAREGTAAFLEKRKPRRAVG